MEINLKEVTRKDLMVGPVKKIIMSVWVDSHSHSCWETKMK